jgi:hypothetical protein
MSCNWRSVCTHRINYEATDWDILNPQVEHPLFFDGVMLLIADIGSLILTALQISFS